MEKAFVERLAASQVLKEVVAAGNFGTKTGSGFLTLEPDKRDELIAYRNKAYPRMSELLRELGPSPLSSGSDDDFSGAR